MTPSSFSKFLLLSLLAGNNAATALLPPALVHTAVGFVAGSTGAIAAYPIDYVKSQLQTEQGRLKYKGGLDAAKDIVTTSGPFALYRGLLVNVVGIAPEKTIKLSANSICRGALLGYFGYLPLAGEVAAGGFAGFTQVLVTNPLEVVKLKLQTSQMTVQDVLSQVQGVSDLYQGAGACIARDVVFSAILFPVYAHTKVALAAAFLGMGIIESPETAAFWADLLAGSFAAAPAALISTPADVVKTRLQQARSTSDEETVLLGNLKGDNHQSVVPQNIQLCSSNQLTLTPEDNKDRSSSFFVVMGNIAQEEGPEVLFSGWFERVVRSVPQFGVTLAVFDLLNTYAVHHGWLLEQAAH